MVGTGGKENLPPVPVSTAAGPGSSESLELCMQAPITPWLLYWSGGGLKLCNVAGWDMSLPGIMGKGQNGGESCMEEQLSYTEPSRAWQSVGQKQRRQQNWGHAGTCTKHNKGHHKAQEDNQGVSGDVAMHGDAGHHSFSDLSDER